MPSREVSKCIKNYVQDRNKSGNVLDDFKQLNMERLADTTLQKKFFSDPTTNTKINTQLETFKQKLPTDMSQEERKKKIELETDKLQKKAFTDYSVTDVGKSDRKESLNNLKKQYFKEPDTTWGQI